MGFDFSKYSGIWDAIASRHTPPGPLNDCSPGGRATLWSGATIQGMLIDRNLPYHGNCGQGVQPNQGELLGAEVTAQISGSVPGAGLISNILNAINAHHVQAVQTEQAVECQVTQEFNYYLPQIDNAVASGTISADQGISAVAQLVSKLKQELSRIAGAGSGGHPCNAGCCFGYWLDCHADFVETFYKDISPMAILGTPGQPNATAPASTLNAIADQLFPPQGSPIMTNGFPWGTALFFLVLFGLIIYGLKKA